MTIHILPTVKQEPNLDLVATLMHLLQEAEEGKIRAAGIAVLYSPTDARHTFIGAQEDIDQRVLLAEIQLLNVDTAIAMASTDHGTFCSSLLTTQDEE